MLIKDEILESEDNFNELAEFFRIFGDSTRLKILSCLCKSEMCVGDLSNLVGLNQSAVSHQLKILKQSRIVRSRRRGKNINYSLDDDHIGSVLKIGFEHILEGREDA